MKELKKRRMQIHLMIEMGVFTLFFLAAPFAVSVLWEGNRLEAGLILVFCYLFFMFHFYKRIYLPVTTIERAVHGMVQEKPELEWLDMKKKSSLYPLYHDLNILMQTLEELVSKEANARLMKKQAELDALQSKINPHFLYNTLESIRGQAIVYGLNDIEVMTQALSNLFRYSVSSEGNMVALEKELKNINHYLMIQQYRFNNKFLYENHVDEDTLGLQIPKLLLQPIIENSVYHGLETKVGKGTIAIHAYRTEKRLLIQIRDDGEGIPKEKLMAINDVLNNGKSLENAKKAEMNIGLANVNERIKLNFGQEFGLRVYSAQKVGTSVEFVLPCLEAKTDYR